MLGALDFIHKEVIALAGKVLEAQKHSYRLHSGAQQLYPKLATLLQSQKHSCCPSVTFQFVLFLSNNPKVCGVVRASGA